MTYLEILGWDRKGVIAVLPFFFIWGVRGRWPRHPAQGSGEKGKAPPAGAEDGGGIKNPPVIPGERRGGRGRLRWRPTMRGDTGAGRRRSVF